MYVVKRGNKYRFGEQFKDPLTDKRRAVTVTYDRNTRNVRHKAQLILDKKINQKLAEATGKRLVQTDITLQELYDEFWAERSNSWRPTTKKVYELSLTRFIAYFGSDAKAKKITPALLSDYFDSLVALVTARKAGKEVNSDEPKFRSISGLKMYRRHISMLFNYGVHKRYLKANPIRSVKTQWPKEDKAGAAKKYLEDDERTSVIDFVKQRHPLIADMLLWQYYTGMRFGEAAAIQLSDVDLKPKTVHVTGTLDYTSSTKSSEFSKQYMTKTEAGLRDIALPDQAVAIYKRQSAGKKQTDFLFTTPEGNLISPNSVDTMLRKCKQKLGLDKTLTTHTFRHTHISKLAELGVPLYVIQHNVGHSDDKITRDIYLHVTKKAQQLLRQKLSSM